MGYEVGFGVEFVVTEGRIENTCVLEGGVVRDYLEVLFEVKSEITAENSRELTGEIYFSADNQPSPDRVGEWIFYTENRFRAAIPLSPQLLERMWGAFATKPQWFLVTIQEGPPIPKVATSVSGDFRISYRAGSIVPPERR